MSSLEPGGSKPLGVSRATDFETSERGEGEREGSRENVSGGDLPEPRLQLLERGNL